LMRFGLSWSKPIILFPCRVPSYRENSGSLPSSSSSHFSLLSASLPPPPTILPSAANTSYSATPLRLFGILDVRMPLDF
jgi:hypothetical protein